LIKETKVESFQIGTLHLEMGLNDSPTG
jgi:hypothetical protein